MVLLNFDEYKAMKQSEAPPPPEYSEEAKKVWLYEFVTQPPEKITLFFSPSKEINQNPELWAKGSRLNLVIGCVKTVEAEPVYYLNLINGHTYRFRDRLGMAIFVKLKKVKSHHPPKLSPEIEKIVNEYKYRTTC